MTNAPKPESHLARRFRYRGICLDNLSRQLQRHTDLNHPTLQRFNPLPLSIHYLTERIATDEQWPNPRGLLRDLMHATMDAKEYITAERRRPHYDWRRLQALETLHLLLTSAVHHTAAMDEVYQRQQTIYQRGDSQD